MIYELRSSNRKNERLCRSRSIRAIQREINCRFGEYVVLRRTSSGYDVGIQIDEVFRPLARVLRIRESRGVLLEERA